MAIFNKIDKPADYSSNVTTIAAGSRFTGKLEIECCLHIDGDFNGDINSTNTVEVGETGVLKCELKAKKLIVAGKFFGNAECESVELVSGGEVQGKLITVSLAIDSGGSFQGESIRKKPGDSPKVADFVAESNPFKGITDDKKGTSRARQTPGEVIPGGVK